MGNKTLEQKKLVNNLEIFYNSGKEVTNCFRNYAKMMLDAGYKENRMEQNKNKQNRHQQDLTY